MSVVKHHPPASSSARPLDALLADFAAGSLSPPLHALIGAHLDLSPQSRRFVDDLEALRAAEVLSVPAPLSRSDAMLEAIFGSLDAPAQDVQTSVDAVFTPSLRDFIGVGSSDVPWRNVLPGVKEYLVSDGDGIEARLYWIKPGRKMPSHTHDGDEVTLVLKGGFSDVSGHYRRGDVAIADEDLDHKPVADDDEDCICFAVTNAPLRLTGPVGKLIQTLFRN
jgi:putative transcriptional regulator